MATVRQVAQAILDEYLPGRADALEPWRRAVAELATVPPCSKQLGRMIEIAITLDLAGSVPYREALDYLPAVDRSRLLSAFGFDGEDDVSDQRQVRVNEQQTDYLRRDALTMIFAVDLAQQIHDGTPARTPEERAAYEFTPVAPPPPVLDRLCAAWDIYTRAGRYQLRRLGPVGGVQVALADGGLRADLILGRTVVDIKALSSAADGLEYAFDQLLGYALSDNHDADAIARIGMYLAWHGVVLTLDIDEIIRLSGGITVDDLRRRFMDQSADARAELARLNVRRHQR